MVCDLPCIVRETGHSPKLRMVRFRSGVMVHTCNLSPWATEAWSCARGLLCCEFWANLGSRDPFHQRRAKMIKFGYGDIVFKKGLREGWGTLQSLGLPQSTPPPRAQNTGKVLNPYVTTKMYTDFTSIQLAFHICGVNISGSEILRNRLVSWLCGSESVLLIQGTRVLSPEPTCRECKGNQLP